MKAALCAPGGNCCSVKIQELDSLNGHVAKVDFPEPKEVKLPPSRERYCRQSVNGDSPVVEEPQESSPVKKYLAQDEIVSYSYTARQSTILEAAKLPPAEASGTSPSPAISPATQAKATQKMKEALQGPIYFNGEKSTLTLKAAWQVAQAAEVMKEFPLLPWRATGYTGPPGGKFDTVTKVQALARLRCSVVCEGLRKEGSKNPVFKKNMGHVDAGGPRVELSVGHSEDEDKARQKLKGLITVPLQYNGESSKLTVKADIQISQIAEVLFEVPDLLIKVKGFSGPPGGTWNTVEKAQELSKLRALSAREALRALGVQNAIFARSLGHVDDGGPRVEVTDATSADEAESSRTLNTMLSHKLDFNSGSSNLTNKAQFQLEQLAEVLKELPETGVTISAYTGSPQGQWNTQEKVLQLSQLRCQTVREALRSAGATNAIFANARGYADEEGPRVVMTSAGKADEDRARIKLQSVLKSNIEFNGESATLTQLGAWQVEQVAESLKEFPRMYVSAIGYTGPPGGKWNTESKVKELSELRCRSVRDALQAKGVTNIIAVYGKGHCDDLGARVVLKVAAATEAVKRGSILEAFQANFPGSY